MDKNRPLPRIARFEVCSDWQGRKQKGTAEAVPYKVFQFVADEKSSKTRRIYGEQSSCISSS